VAQLHDRYDDDVMMEGRQRIQIEQTFRMPVAKWPELEAEVNSWITHHKNNRIFVFTKMIIFKVSSCAVGGITPETVRTAKHETSVLVILCC
jgi:hypothetical protein